MEPSSFNDLGSPEEAGGSEEDEYSLDIQTLCHPGGKLQDFRDTEMDWRFTYLYL